MSRSRNLKITLSSPGGQTISEISSLERHVREEVKAFSQKSGVTLEGSDLTPPPEGTQGIAEALQFILAVAEHVDADMITSLLLALRVLLRQSNEDSDQGETTINVTIDNRSFDLSDSDIVIADEVRQLTNEKNTDN